MVKNCRVNEILKMLTLKTECLRGGKEEAQGGIYGYIEMIHFVVQRKTNTTLQSNYTPAKKQKEFRSTDENSSFPCSWVRP